MKTERELFGQLDWMGAFNRAEPTSYLKLEQDRIPYKGYPKLKPQNLHGVQFIIDTIMANPGEVTILAIDEPLKKFLRDIFFFMFVLLIFFL